MKNSKVAFILVLVAVLFHSCKKDPEAGPAGSQGAAGPSLTGNLEGYVSLWDQYGGRILNSQANDTITLIGTTNKVYTDSTGFYKFQGLSTGVYSISVNKGGYGSTMAQNIQFVGGGNAIANVKLSQPSTTIVPALADSIGAVTGNITIYATLPTTSAQSRTFILYLGNTSSVSSSPATYLNYYTKVVNPGANSTRLTFTIPKSDLYNAGFSTGASAYFAAYGIGATLTASAYIDYNNEGRTVFTALSFPPSTTSLIVP